MTLITKTRLDGVAWGWYNDCMNPTTITIRFFIRTDDGIMHGPFRSGRAAAHYRRDNELEGSLIARRS